MDDPDGVLGDLYRLLREGLVEVVDDNEHDWASPRFQITAHGRDALVSETSETSPAAG